MCLELSAAQFPHAKALIVVVLAAWVVARTGVTAGLTPESVILTCYTLNEAPTPVLVKRYLRPNAEMTGSDQTDNSEERASLSGLAARLETWSRNLQLWWRRLWWNFSERMFTRLRLHTKDDKLFESPDFFKWVDFIKAKYPDSPAMVFEKMLSVLAVHYEDEAALGKVLVAGTEIENTRTIANKLLELQLTKWGKTKSMFEIFGLLGLEARTELFEMPAFATWVNFVEFGRIETQTPPRVSFEMIFLTLANHYPDYAALAKALHAGTKIVSMKALAETLEGFRKNLVDEKQPMEESFTFLSHGQTKD